MRLRTCTLLFCLFWAGNVAAQKKLFGLTRGENGRLIEYIAGSTTVTTKHEFTEGTLPWYNNLIQASDGKLYGMTESGGSFGKGILFSYDPAQAAPINELYSFGATPSSPVSPFGSLIQAADGKLYGMTESGGTNEMGTIFSYDFSVSDNNLAVLHNFDGVNGRPPYGSLLEASNGKLYGVTESGGANDFGTIFSFDPVSSVYDLLHDFEYLPNPSNPPRADDIFKYRALNGRSPYGSLIQVGTELFGTAQFGGVSSYGVIFSVSLTGSFTKRADFNWTNGAWPNSSLVKVGNKLYGTAETGGPNTTTEHIGLSSYGVIYSFDPSNNSITKHFDFSANEAEENGRTPYGKLTLASDGLLYGMTFRGGNEDKGVLYSFDPADNTFNKKLEFTGANGMNPAASLVEYTPPTPLPLTLVSFTARENNNKVQLYWDVESEFDMARYEIERSTDGVNFSQIGAVTAINSQTRHQYNYTDLQPAGGKNYYRLKIIERYKAPHYSDIKVVSRGREAFSVSVQPNPVTANSTIYMSLQGRSRVQMTLYNAQGARIKQWPASTLDKGVHHLPLNLADVPGGSYILVVEAGKSKQSMQLIKGTKN